MTATSRLFYVLCLTLGCVALGCQLSPSPDAVVSPPAPAAVSRSSSEEAEEERKERSSIEAPPIRTAPLGETEGVIEAPPLLD